jgi:hypothetical protein
VAIPTIDDSTLDGFMRKPVASWPARQAECLAWHPIRPSLAVGCGDGQNVDVHEIDGHSNKPIHLPGAPLSLAWDANGGTLAVAHSTGVWLEVGGIGQGLPTSANIAYTAATWNPSSGVLYAGRPDGTVVAFYEGKPLSPAPSLNLGAPVVQLLALDERLLIGVLRDYTGFSLNWSETTPRELLDARPEVTCLDRNPRTGSIACGCRDGSIHLREPSSAGSRVQSAAKTEISSLSFSSDGSLIAAAPVVGPPMIWRVRDWHSLPAPDVQIKSRGKGIVCFHPSQPLLAVADGDAVQVFEFESRSTTDTAAGSAPPVSPSSRSTPNTYFADSTASDHATKDDALGFRPYVSALARFLVNDQTSAPLTVSIEGEWGSGKSSFMLQLREALGVEEKLTIQFNAWRHDREDALWAAFVLEFARQIAHQRSVWQRLRCQLNLLRRRWDWKAGWLEVTKIALLLGLVAGATYAAWSGISHLSDIASAKTPGAAVLVLLWGVWKLWQRMPSGLRKFLKIDVKKALQSPDYSQRVAFVERLHEDFRKVVEAYAGDEKVFVFIDDLDRCEIPRAADLMQALNLLMLDEPQLVFILGMDREKVAAGLAAKHEKLLPYLGHRPDCTSPVDGLAYGYQFIEKFIQIPFPLPRPGTADVDKMLSRVCDVPATSADADVSRPRRWSWPWGSRSTNDPKSGRLDDGVRVLPKEQDGDRAPADPSVEDAGLGGAPAPEAKTVWELGPKDAPVVREIAGAVAPHLGNNPRRIKQFINLLRLRACVAYETGLIPELGGSQNTSRVALCRLGKFTAISLQSPRLLTDLLREPSLLAALQREALGQSVDEAQQTDRFNWWVADRELKALLRHGCCEVDGDEGSDWLLDGPGIARLLEVSPPVQTITVNPPASGSDVQEADGRAAYDLTQAPETSRLDQPTPANQTDAVVGHRRAEEAPTTAETVDDDSRPIPPEAETRKAVPSRERLSASQQSAADEREAIERLRKIVQDVGGKLSVHSRGNDGGTDAEIEFVGGDQPPLVLRTQLKRVASRDDLSHVRSSTVIRSTDEASSRFGQPVLLVAYDGQQGLYGTLQRATEDSLRPMFDWRELTVETLQRMADDARDWPAIGRAR